MAHSVTLGAKIYVAHFDISGDVNAHGINHTITLLDDTCYGDTFRQKFVGVREMNFSIAGNVNLEGTTDSDTIIDARMAVQDVPIILCPTGAAVGDTCEFGLIAAGEYKRDLKFGEIYKYSLAGQLATRSWVLGKVLADPATLVTGTVNGAQVLIGAASATQKLYVAIAITQYTGAGSITVRVESDTTGFPSATVRKTFTAATAVTSENPTPVDGAITDTFYRAAVSAFTATNANMIVAAGIQ